jgi:RPA family protein
MKRQTAWRVFAGEYNDSSYEIKGEGEMSPSFIVTPLGAKINRLFMIGVLTDVENISDEGGLVRAHISDPTGVFTIYSGQYQKDVTDNLLKIEVPTFVAIVGKSRTYSPEEGTIYVSVRPEKIMEVSAEIRDRWILETCKNTKNRIEAIVEAMKMNEKNSFELIKLGYSKELSEGVVEALENYENIDLNKYISIIQESLQYLRPGKESLPDLRINNKKEKNVIYEKSDQKNNVLNDEKIDKDSLEIEEQELTINTDDKEEIKENDHSFEVIENKVLSIIKKSEDDDGAAWDVITQKCEKAGIEKDSIEEALTSLMDKGLIYEPILGTIKTT